MHEGGETLDLSEGVVLGPEAGKLVWLGGMGVRFMIDGSQSGGRFALVEHPILPGALVAPMHTHHDEDEFSFILEGEVGLKLGDRVLTATPGMLVFKPREIPHTFWNAGTQTARLLEMISPAGFEQYFAEMARLLDATNGRPEPERIGALLGRYHLDLHPETLGPIGREHGVRLLPQPEPGFQPPAR